jgi:hypothetical protein
MALGTVDLRDTSQILDFGGADLSTTTVATFGEDEAYAEVERVLQIHNALVAELVDELCQVTTDYQAVYGGVPSMKMFRGNEYSNPLVQKVKTGVTMGFPLEKSEMALQWTRRSFEQMTLGRFRLLIQSALLADVKDFRTSLMRGIFNPENDPDYEDYLVDYRNIPLFAFLNGDGQPVPTADGTAFDGDHTHYTYATALTEQAVRDVLTNVSEHGVTGELKIFIPRSFENTMWSFQASGAFHPFLQANIVPGANASYAVGQTLDMRNQHNRSIGYFDGSEVVVRSWVPAKYIVVVDTGAPNDKPLAYRVLPNGLNAELGLRFENETYPLRAQVMDRFYGISPWQRHKVAVLYVDSAASGYVAPTTYPGT